MADLHDHVTFCDLVLTALRRHATKDAFRYEGQTITNAEVEDALSRMVDLLQRRGFQHGDGVGVLSPNRPEVFYVQTAPLFAGGRYRRFTRWDHSTTTSTPAMRPNFGSCLSTLPTPSEALH